MTPSVPAASRSSAGSVLLTLCIALFLVGCSTGGALSTAAESPLVIGPEASYGVQRGTETERGEIDPPIDYTPDQFWAMMSNVPDFTPRTGSLEEAFAAAEVILIGQAVDVVQAGGYGAQGEPTLWYAEAVIEVSDVLKGEPALDESGLLHIPFAIGMGFDDMYPTHVLKDFQRAMAKEPALLLLNSWSTYFEAAGGDTPKAFHGLNRSDLYLTIGPEGAMRVTANGVQPPLAEGWAADLGVTSLADLKDQISEQAPVP